MMKSGSQDRRVISPILLFSTTHCICFRFTNYTITAADTVGAVKYIKMAMPAGTVLPAGTYFFAINEPVGLNMGLCQTQNIFTVGTSFVDWATSSPHWRDLNVFGGTFVRALVIHALVSAAPACALTGASATATAIACNGGNNGSATALAVGTTTGLTYAWNTTPAQTTATATGLVAGTYTVTISAGVGCSRTATVVVAQPTAVAATITITGTSATVVASGGVSPYTYLWSNGSTTATVTGLPLGNHAVTVTDANGCTKVTSADVVGTKDIKGVSKLDVSPNPTNGVFRIALTLTAPQDVTIDIVNPQGQLLKSITQKAAYDETFNFDLSNQAAGIYFAKITIGKETTTVTKVFVVK